MFAIHQNDFITLNDDASGIILERDVEETVPKLREKSLYLDKIYRNNIPKDYHQSDKGLSASLHIYT